MFSIIIYNFCLIQFVHYAQYNFVVPVGKLTILCLALLNFSYTTRVVQLLAILMNVEQKMKTEEETQSVCEWI